MVKIRNMGCFKGNEFTSIEFFMLKNCMILTQERSKKYGKDDKRTLRKT